MFKKIIFLIFKNNYRYYALGNFGKSKKYLNYRIISLGGRLQSFIGIIFYYLNIGKFISIDGNPFLKNQKNSINVWFTGTTLKILTKFRGYKNNYVNMHNPITYEEKKIFQIYPIILKKNFFYKNPKIIFMGKFYFKPDKRILKASYLSKKKNDFLNNFSLIDDKNFWHKSHENININQIFEKYKIIKTYLREQIILHISKNFKKKFYIYGEDRKNVGMNILEPEYDNIKVKRIYEGNICIDTGSVLGSLSLHPRSIQILESNGLLIQARQNDYKEVWGDLNGKIVFNNIDNLLNGIELMMSNKNIFEEYLNLIYEKFLNSEQKIAHTLDSVFK